MKVNWATSPGNAPKQDTSSKLITHTDSLFRIFFAYRYGSIGKLLPCRLWLHHHRAFCGRRAVDQRTLSSATPGVPRHDIRIGGGAEIADKTVLPNKQPSINRCIAKSDLSRRTEPAMMPLLASRHSSTFASLDHLIQ